MLTSAQLIVLVTGLSVSLAADTIPIGAVLANFSAHQLHDVTVRGTIIDIQELPPIYWTTRGCQRSVPVLPEGQNGYDRDPGGTTLHAQGISDCCSSWPNPRSSRRGSGTGCLRMSYRFCSCVRDTTLWRLIVRNASFQNGLGPLALPDEGQASFPLESLGRYYCV